jgi:glutamate transport system ATP-binding protein
LVLAGRQQALRALHVLKDVDLTVDRGEVVVVIGPSGLGQVDPVPHHQPARDDRHRHDHRRRRAAAAEGKQLAQLRSRVGMVFQSFNLFAHKTVLENVTSARSR